jgi:hypothetical protein
MSDSPDRQNLSDVAHVAVRSGLKMRVKRPAPGSEFVEPIQPDFTRPDQARKIFRFSFAPNSVFP